MMIIFIMLFEFQYSAMVERKLAYNELNQIQAHYLAKSGARIGLLRVALYGRARRSQDLKKAVGQLDINPYLDMIWNLPLPPFPPETGTLKNLLKEDRDAAEKTLEQTKVTEGHSTHVVSSESAKINLNYLIVPQELKNERISFSGTPKTLFEHVGALLINLMENFLKESEAPYEEYGDLRPEEIVFNIMDWVNPGSTSYSGGTKDSYYEQLQPPYKAKRNRFYTKDELRLVKGINDHLYEKLRPYITVYSYDGRINLNTAGASLYRALYKDFTDYDIQRIMEQRTQLGSWASEKQFIDFVSGTLGRSGFRTLYNDEKQYPFTVSSQSFLIESMGMIQKSKTQVQKVIRVAVTLAKGKGGTILSDKLTEQDCQKAGAFWNTELRVCVTKPNNKQECEGIGGQWFDTGKEKYCKIPNQQPIYADTGKGDTAQQPNSLKILYWSET